MTNLRIAGPDRIGTAIAASQWAFPTPGAAGVVVLARDDVFADALTGGPLAAADDGPLLLTDPTSLLPQTSQELRRVLRTGGTVYLLGEQAALSDAVAQQVANLGYTVVRIGGIDRFATAVAIARALGDPATIFEATGLSFPDALAAAPAAAHEKGAILLTVGDVQSTETAAYLADHPGDVRIDIGGAASLADPSAETISGPDRYATAIAVATKFFTNPSTVGVASGVDWPDALVAAPVLSMRGAPLLLAGGTADDDALVSAYLATLRGMGTTITFGGPAAVPSPPT